MSYRAAHAFQVQAIWLTPFHSVIQKNATKQLPAKGRQGSLFFQSTIYVNASVKYVQEGKEQCLIKLSYSQLCSSSPDLQLSKVTQHTIPLLWIWNPSLSSQRLNNRPTFKSKGEKCAQVNLDEVGNKSFGIRIYQRRALQVLTSACLCGLTASVMAEERCFAQQHLT